MSICRAVTLSGAGDRGAVEAGVIAALVANRPAEENQWSFVTGISAGAINAASIAMFGVGNEKAASDFLTSQWLNISKSQVYNNWIPGGILEGILFKQGMYNTEALSEFLHKYVNVEALQSSNRSLLIGATSLTTGLFTIFEKSDPNIIQGVYASAAVPGIFPPVEKDGDTYVDGGETYMTPITDTARLCADTGADQIVIDIILGVGNPEASMNVSSESTIPLLLRSWTIVTHNIFMKDIETAKQAFPSATFNLFYPTQKLPGTFLDFDHSAVLLKYGYEDAVAELQNQNLKIKSLRM
ncbi:patatin family protein [Tieghemostelium lacteum]|uniref:Patatin family protein n=1 Tax=Tieghemostelium lacteum TaxID=361077 RepID=A0A151ZDH3_TIELA|nr:patatin family protein [Tieghemostelium lacteum]|eukprot:KYQ92003.1 patatin family protein [Tieghemostelium lacteum]